MLLDARILFVPGEPVKPEFCRPNAILTLCCAAAIALVYVGDGYGANEVEGRGDNRTCFCGEIYNNKNNNNKKPNRIQWSSKGK